VPDKFPKINIEDIEKKDSLFKVAKKYLGKLFPMGFCALL
jgi:hypothetical protein